MAAKEVSLTEIPNSYFKRFLGKGTEGSCYLTEDNEVFKHFCSSRVDYDVLKFIADTYSSSHLVLPNTFLFMGDICEKNLIGYLSQYIVGDHFDQLKDSIDLKTFLVALNKLEKEMIDNSFHGLVYNDMHSENLFYTPEDEIKVIDQSLYDVSYKDDFRYRAYDNLRDLAATIIPTFFGHDDPNSKELCRVIMICGGSLDDFMRPSEMVEASVDILERLNESRISTYGDFKKNVRALRK
jgi:hypothetical protein